MMSSRLEYSRRLYDSVLGWYNSADLKAQVVLAIDTVFLAFLASAIFAEPTNLKKVIEAFSWLTWLTFSLMFLSLFVSIGAAISCLYSRTYSLHEVRQIIQKAESRAKDSHIYPPEPVVFFFQFIKELNEQKFQATLDAVGEDFEIEVLSREIYILSKNVSKKHQAVNIGFGAAGVSLILFAIAAVSYLVSAI